MMRTLGLTLILTLILLGAAWANMASVGKENVNVRSAPNLQADVIYQIHLGFPVEVQQTKGSWVQIKDWDGNTGWVYRPLINRKVQTALVIPERINVRKGPGLRYRVVNQATGGEIYKIFGEEGNWIKIGYYLEDQEVGWVRSDLVWGE
jgi:uncharacterized protein YgiM (DUF1202 family)